MAVRVFTNNAEGALASSISSGATTLTLGSGQGALFASPSGGDWQDVTLDDGVHIEICRCTARSGDTLTVTRAQEGTTAQSFAVGAKVEARWTAGAATDASATGLTNWAEAVSTAAPNATVPAVSLTVLNGATNVDAVVRPKGTGAVLAQVPDGTTTGGDKRGTKSVDLQMGRSLSIHVASGNYSAVLGGQSNAATGDWSIAGGNSCSASGVTSTAFGSSCTASNTNAFAAGVSCVASGVSAVSLGQSNTSSGAAATTLGYSCTANSNYGVAIGHGASTHGCQSLHARASYAHFTSAGHGQFARLVIAKQTADATQATLISDAAGTVTANQFRLSDNMTCVVDGQIVARQNTTGDSASWKFTAHVYRGSGVATVALGAAVTPTQVYAASGAAAWAVSVDADTANGCLRVRVTGEAAKTIRWVCTMNATQVVG